MPIFHSVERDEEFERIFSLAERPAPDPDDPEILALARELTVRLRRVPAPYPLPSESASLFPTQALALREAFENRGMLAPIRTGGGKTLTLYLIFAVLGAKRPLLLIPASMERETREAYARFEKDWHGPRLADVTILSYEKLSNPSSSAKVLTDGTVVLPSLIDRIAPDVVCMDECDRLADMTAAGTRRIGRHLDAREHVPVVATSGTLIRRSLKDAAHVAEWTLGKRAPLPLTFETLQAWSDALDARTKSGGKRTDMGALLEVLSEDERRAFDLAESEEDARAIVVGRVGRRLLETPGVLSSQDGPLAIPARFDAYLPETEDPAIEEEFVKLLVGDDERAAWTLPDGTPLMDARALARPLATLSTGFYLVQDPAPPPDYRTARSGWATAVHDVLKYRKDLELDSEYTIRQAVENGVLEEYLETLDEWKSAQRAYRERTGLAEPPSVPIWISDETVTAVAEWLEEGPGLVWVNFIALGEKLSRALRLPYFGSGKVDATGRHVTRLKKGESAVLSMSAVGRGTDGLQRIHHRQLWIGAPSEQPLARLHRPGQLAECVRNDIYLGGGVQLTRFWRARELAANFAGRITGIPQKAAYFENHVPERIERDGRRWALVAKSTVGDIGEDA